MIKNYHGDVTFSSGNDIPVGLTAPTDVKNLDATQKQVAITVYYRDVTSIPLKFTSFMPYLYIGGFSPAMVDDLCKSF